MIYARSRAQSLLKFTFQDLKIDPFQSRQAQNASKHAVNSPELRTTTPALKRTKPSGGRFAKRSQ